MRLCLFTIVSALSLLLAICMVFLWVRSYWGCDSIGWVAFQGTYDRGVDLYSSPGRIGLGFFHCIDHHPEWDSPAFLPRRAEFTAETRADPPYGPHGRYNWGSFDFVYDGGDDRPGQRFQDIIRIVEVPSWSVVLCSLLLPSSWIISRRPLRTRRRLALGLCTAFGYDLLASPDRCPECGTPVPTKGVA